MYGGFHSDPSSRREFLRRIRERPIPPQFVAVEWERSVFEACAAQRPRIAKELTDRWSFLSPTDADELSRCFAREGDTHTLVFPGSETLWLEDGYQAARLRVTGATPGSMARDLIELFTNPMHQTLAEFFDRESRPIEEPTSLADLLRLIARHRSWTNDATRPEEMNLDRDARWAAMIEKRLTRCDDGWFAVVVGWAHVEAGTTQNLRALLTAAGMNVNAVRLEAPPM
jgi:hypothetical protein